MTKDELLQRVMQSAPPDLHEVFVQAAIWDMWSDIVKQPQNFPKLKQVIIEKAYKEKRQYILETSPWSLLTFADMLTNEVLLDAITPQIEQLRQIGFGDTKPPFKTLDEAAAWIEQQADNDRKAALAQYGEERGKAFEQIQSLARQYGFGISFKTDTLPYVHEGDTWTECVPVWPKTYLARLEYETRQLAEATGFPQAHLVCHVLTGLKPLVPRFRITSHEKYYTLPDGRQLHRKWVTVDYLSGDFTFNETRLLHARLKDEIGTKKLKGIDEKAWKIYHMVKANGGPPQKNKVAFWQQIQQQWNDSVHNDEERYATWNGVKKAYFDTIRRIEEGVIIGQSKKVG